MPADDRRSRTRSSAGRRDTPRRYTYQLDETGTLRHAGDPITHARMLAVFFRNLEPLPDGRFLSRCAGEENVLEVADTPFVVIGLEIERDDDGRVQHVQLVLNDTRREPLDPETVSIGGNDVVYCRVREGAFPARFGRTAQLSFLSLAEERGANVVLDVGPHTIVLGPRT